jgi:hypothetical protein
MIKERHPLLGIREEVATKRLPSLLWTKNIHRAQRIMSSYLIKY